MFWIPLESNPEVLEEYAKKIGITNIGSEYRFQDVYGLEPDLLAFIPPPTLAVLLLFPISEDTEKLRLEEEKNSPETSSDVYYMKQTIGNACGTIGLLHAVLNNTEALKFAPGSFLDSFSSATKDLTPEQRGKYLECPPENAISLASIHKNAAEQGQTAVPEPDADVDLHFVAFVQHNGRLIELDGRKSHPIDHGAIPSPESGNSVLLATAKIVQKNFVEKANSLNFSLIALAGSHE